MFKLNHLFTCLVEISLTVSRACGGEGWCRDIPVIQKLQAFTNPSVPNRLELKSLRKGLGDLGRKGANVFGVFWGGGDENV